MSDEREKDAPVPQSGGEAIYDFVLCEGCSKRTYDIGEFRDVCAECFAKITAPTPEGVWALVAKWRKQPSHQDTMPLSKEAQAVMFTRSICADELEAALLAERERVDEQGALRRVTAEQCIAAYLKTQHLSSPRQIGEVLAHELNAALATPPAGKGDAEGLKRRY